MYRIKATMYLFTYINESLKYLENYCYNEAEAIDIDTIYWRVISGWP